MPRADPPVVKMIGYHNGARGQGSAPPRRKPARPCPLCAVVEKHSLRRAAPAGSRDRGKLGRPLPAGRPTRRIWEPMTQPILQNLTNTTFLLTKPNTLPHNQGASVATLRWCSGLFQNAVQLPSGTSVQLRRIPHFIKNFRRKALSNLDGGIPYYKMPKLRRGTGIRQRMVNSSGVRTILGCNHSAYVR